MKWLGALVSGCVVYGLVAACSGVAEDPPKGLTSNYDAGTPDGSAGAGGSDYAGSGGSLGGSSDGGGIPDALADVFDALTDPIPDALADGAGDTGDADDDGSGSRLKTQRYAGADGSSMRVLSMWDSELQTRCMFGLAADGSTRCLPMGYSAASVYSDGNCSVPLFASSGTAEACGSAQGWGAINVGSCGERRLFKLGAVHSGQVYGGITGNCLPIDNPCKAQNVSCELLAGSEVEPSAFVAAELVSG